MANIKSAGSTPTVSQLQEKLRSAERLLHFSKEHHSITVTALQAEVLSLRQRCSTLTFQLSISQDGGKAADTGKQHNDKEDETVHLRKVIHHLRHQNLELETLLLNTRQRLELATSATSTSLVVPDRSEDCSTDRHADSTPTEDRRQAFHTKSHSVPEGVALAPRHTKKRQLPALPDSEDTQQSHTNPVLSRSTSDVCISKNKIIPQPPTTARPENIRLNKLRSRSMLSMSDRLKDIQTEYDEVFGVPAMELWELPVDTQLQAARLEYQRAKLLSKERPQGMIIPKKPKQETETEYLIYRGVLSQDGTSQLPAMPPRDTPTLPPLHMSVTGHSVKNLRDRNAFAGPRLANVEPLTKTKKARDALARSQSLSGSHSSVDLTSVLAPEVSAMPLRRHHLLTKGDSPMLRRRRTMPHSMSLGQQIDYHGGNRIAYTPQDDIVDVHDTSISPHALSPVVDQYAASGRVHDGSRNAGKASSPRVVALPNQLAAKVFTSPYMGARAQKLAARAALHEPASRYPKEMSKRTPSAEQATKK